MKNLFSFFLFVSLFLFATVPSIVAGSVSIDGGFEAHVHQVKTGELVCTFSLPDNYLKKDGSLAIPFEITFTQDQITSVFNTVSQDLIINLPSSLSGTYYVKILIGDFEFFQKITI